jgi:predicted O-methyltransferase YrrM
MQADDPLITPAKKVITKLVKPRFSLVDLALFASVLGILSAGIAWYKMMVYTNQLNAAVFQSPLPDVRVTEEKLVPDSSAYQKKYEFTVNWFTYNIPVWEKVLSPYKGKADLRYLEIGLFEGRSAIWMLENILTHPTARLTGIDVFDGPYKGRYFANIERSGSSGKVTTITGYSQLELRGVPLKHFDIIYIDGSHSKDDVMEDAVLCWRLLREGGLLIFDDYRWAGCFASGTSDAPTDFPKAAIDRFVQCFDSQLRVIHNAYQLILKKVPTEGK